MKYFILLVYIKFICALSFISIKYPLNFIFSFILKFFMYLTLFYNDTFYFINPFSSPRDGSIQLHFHI